MPLEAALNNLVDCLPNQRCQPRSMKVEHALVRVLQLYQESPHYEARQLQTAFQAKAHHKLATKCPSFSLELRVSRSFRLHIRMDSKQNLRLRVACLMTGGSYGTMKHKPWKDCRKSPLGLRIYRCRLPSRTRHSSCLEHRTLNPEAGYPDRC